MGWGGVGFGSFMFGGAKGYVNGIYNLYVVDLLPALAVSATPVTAS